ncbi:MAG: alpha/beta hydrolase [Xanthobacteraceae bacterium]|nr:alpha/beta hydrolase [Xanthobacteraceae bacterium]
MNHLPRCALALMLGLLAGAAVAGQLSRDIAAKETAAAIEAPGAPANVTPLPPGTKVERDIKYGPDDRNLLDVVSPGPVSGSARPVLVFVHGGAFVGGDKQMPGKPYYDNVMMAAIADGFVGVNMTYRLAPGSPWPAGAEDVGAAVRWVADNIAARGGDPARIYLMGHSSGAVHVATYLAHREFQGPHGDLLAGAILISGFYDLTSMELTDQRRAYFGSDASTYKDRSSLDGLIASRTPLLVLRAETEPEVFAQQFDELRDRLCASPRGCVQTGVLPQHRHANAVQSIDGRGSALFRQLVAFVNGGKSPEPVEKTDRAKP